jgi:hypothetical protein
MLKDRDRGQGLVIEGEQLEQQRIAARACGARTNRSPVLGQVQVGVGVVPCHCRGVGDRHREPDDRRGAQHEREAAMLAR